METKNLITCILNMDGFCGQYDHLTISEALDMLSVLICSGNVAACIVEAVERLETLSMVCEV